MPKGPPLFVVEGYLEHEFLHAICNKKARILKLSNGKQVSPASLAKQVFAQAAAAAQQPSYIIVIADREKRPETASNIEDQVSKELKRLGLKIGFSVHVPDQMIENWILADIETVKNEGFDPTLKSGSEGCHGKNVLGEAFKTKNRNYKERIDGVRLLKSCRASIIRKCSPSFDRLCIHLSKILINCYWLKQ